MKKTLFCAAIVGTLMAGGAVVWAQAGDAKEPKYTIKEVMTKAHKDGLMKKVVEGQGSPEDKAQLLDLYLSLVEQDPPKGDAKDFHEKASAAVVAAARVVVGRDGAEAELTRAVNCAACHKEHKPPQQ
jgi:hypothetical protein